MTATVELDWDPSSDPHDEEKVYRSTETEPDFPGDYTEIASLGANTGFYEDTDAVAGTQNHYAVTALDDGAESDPVEASIETATFISARAVGVGSGTGNAIGSRPISGTGIGSGTAHPTRGQTQRAIGAGVGSSTTDAVIGRTTTAHGTGFGTGTALATPRLFASQLRVDGDLYAHIHDLQFTPLTLSVSFRTGRDELNDWRAYDRAGDIDQEPGFAGATRTFDRSGREHPVEVDPPDAFTDVLERQTNWHVSDYVEVQHAPDLFELSLTFQRVFNRADVFDTPSESGDWELETERGTIGLAERHVGTTEAAGDPSGRQTTLSLLLNDVQLASWADAAGYPTGVVERTVPDGEDFLSDQSPNKRQTIDVTAPQIAAFDSGRYLAVDWTATLATHAEQRWSLETELWQAERWLIVQSGETYTIEDGGEETYDRVDLHQSGTLNVESGATLNITE